MQAMQMRELYILKPILITLYMVHREFIVTGIQKTADGLRVSPLRPYKKAENRYGCNFYSCQLVESTRNGVFAMREVMLQFTRVSREGGLRKKSRAIPR